MRGEFWQKDVAGGAASRLGARAAGHGGEASRAGSRLQRPRGRVALRTSPSCDDRLPHTRACSQSPGQPEAQWTPVGRGDRLCTRVLGGSGYWGKGVVLYLSPPYTSLFPPSGPPRDPCPPPGPARPRLIPLPGARSLSSRGGVSGPAASRPCRGQPRAELAS